MMGLIGILAYCLFIYFQNKLTLRQYAALLTYHDMVVLIDEHRPTIVSYVVLFRIYLLPEFSKSV